MPILLAFGANMLALHPLTWMTGGLLWIIRLDSLGFELYRVQCGFDPKDWKPEEDTTNEPFGSGNGDEAI
jgi:hypothetical protein